MHVERSVQPTHQKPALCVIHLEENEQIVRVAGHVEIIDGPADVEIVVALKGRTLHAVRTAP